jgi:toxin ParE1/3/4
MKYKISNEAAQDIEDIWFYTQKKWSTDQADRYFNLIINEIEYLSEYPESGSNFSYTRKGYFKSRIKSHLIFYRSSNDIEVIEIIRILHNKMDIERRLSE